MLYIATIIIGILFIIMFFINKSSLFYEESPKKEESKSLHHIKEKNYNDLIK